MCVPCLIKESESSIRIYRKIALINRSELQIHIFTPAAIRTKADNRIRLYRIKSLTSREARALLLIHNYEGR